MFKKLLLLNVFAWSFAAAMFAGPGDTTVVQAFTYGSPQDAIINFPTPTQPWERIIMHYNLKCVPGGAGGLQYPCGEWDYQTYTNLYNNTGMMDSTLLTQSNFMIANTSPQSFPYTTQPVNDYYIFRQPFVAIDQILLLNPHNIGTQATSATYPLGASKPHSRSQFLWTAAELTAAGLTANETIHRINFNVLTAGSALKNLTVKIKAVTQTTLDATNFQTIGLTEVYRKNTSFSTTGWNNLDLLAPFVWNGTSNLLVQISYDNEQAGTDNIVAASPSAFQSGAYTSDSDGYLSFADIDRVDVQNMAAVSSISNEVTVMFWMYGDAVQPQDEWAFEAVDANNNRVLNVHLPWSNSNVYWDAGNNGTASYDRINKAAVTANIEGQWNHWAFTKNATTGEMKIFLNGVLWHSGTGMTKSMSGITKFRIAAPLTTNTYQYYNGSIDEFQVFNTALPVATIAAWKDKRTDNTHPNFANLLLYYDFDNIANNIANDLSPNNSDGAILGLPEHKQHKGEDKFKNWNNATARPDIQFVNCIYNTHLDTLEYVDTIPQTPVTVIMYSDGNNPSVATDTVELWQPNNSNTYLAGQVVSTTPTAAEDTLIRQDWQYYSAPFEIIDKVELFRFITPYGINLDLGTDGWTWTADVSDYAPLLRGAKRMTAGNWQELLDLKFLFIEGTPPREVVSVEDVYDGNFNYTSSANIETTLTAKNMNVPANAVGAKLKIRTSGHGFGGTLNCAEFCPRTNNVKINGTQQFTQYLWDEECAVNPLYPQGGTWLYQRANWCPGKPVPASEFELTPFITPGSPVNIDYDMQSGYTWNNSGSTPYYDIKSQFVTYKAINHSLDVRMEEIVAPSDNKLNRRGNPICGSPIIKFRNAGSQTLTSLTINYGIDGGPTSSYNWTGSLGFMQETEVTLPPFTNNQPWSSALNTFVVTLDNPNGQTDQQLHNNIKRSKFTNVPTITQPVYLYLKTNSAGSENSFDLKDINDNIVASRQYSANGTVYRDTFYLPDGCYTLTIHDSDEDGLSFFANNDGTGAAALRYLNNAIAKNIPGDFGREFSFRFYMQNNVATEPQQNVPLTFDISPNPSDGIFNVNLELRNNVTFQIHDAIGKIILEKKLTEQDDFMSIDLSAYPNGVYTFSLIDEKEMTSKKVVKF